MPTKKESEKSSQGKKSRAKGMAFEAKVRQNLEEMGWTVAKWTNTVDNEKHKVVPAKRKYNPFLKALSIGTGFPDFVCFRKINVGFDISRPIKGAEVIILDADEIPNTERVEEGFDVVGVEVKGNGYLDQIEKGMCIWLLQNKIFSRILIAKKSKEKGKIDYLDFDVKYGNKK
jgi:hypothetical protein